MSRGPDLAALFAGLGLTVDRALIEEALTHPSAASAARPDFQRLEFLGDRVLMLVIAETLLGRHPAETEGQLAPRLNELVRKETCAAVAAEIGLGAHLRLDQGEARSGGRRRTTILADAMEAVIAAIYLDAGLEAARAAVLRLWGARLEAQGGAAVPREPKSALQEWAEGRGLGKPVYAVVAQSGPDHAPLFTVEVALGTGPAARGAARSKREAEKIAAAALLALLATADAS
jgi:ribonuclease-3